MAAAAADSSEPPSTKRRCTDSDDSEESDGGVHESSVLRKLGALVEERAEAHLAKLVAHGGYYRVLLDADDGYDIDEFLACTCSMGSADVVAWAMIKMGVDYTGSTADIAHTCHRHMDEGRTANIIFNVWFTPIFDQSAYDDDDACSTAQGTKRYWMFADAKEVHALLKSGRTPTRCRGDAEYSDDDIDDDIDDYETESYGAAPA